MISSQLRWRMVVGLTAAVGGSFLAGCCGGPFDANGEGGCMACAQQSSAADDCASDDAGADASESMGGHEN